MSKNTKQYFAVFGDVHGRVALMYAASLLWQRETGIQLTGILQVGDMGAFPDPLNVDDATRQHAKVDPDELGFSQFCAHSQDAELFLKPANSPPTYFVRGNHEDFDYLSQFKSPAHVDKYGKINFIPDGHWVHLASHTTIGAFGGIPPVIETKRRGKKSKKTYKKSKLKSLNDPRLFTEEFARTAFNKENKLDILLTHAGPKCASLSEGSLLLTELTERIKPKIHIFGHHHKVIPPCEGPAGNILIGLEHFKFDSSKEKIIKGSWGILVLDGCSAEFTFIDSEDPFLSYINYFDYRSSLTL
ncbi:hypothetical protein EUZ85_27315 [Hahella sp. KA22]|uniref:metallophosphoesterase family protein n=1 Tax=Hahella sp. KA22 TaxID=1628392 RepID=UPI000FDD5475|nr:metallophosphoesterase [Hahella sp. KA22]AZZ94228.1 hypothetical protein ENC22_24730 [Hahella sp. KA22]QAY57602.1 hypothetical protein EUZ85_27315 [Hahella sp. KA22]